MVTRPLLRSLGITGIRPKLTSPECGGAVLAVEEPRGGGVRHAESRQDNHIVAIVEGYFRIDNTGA